jgi:hypothetical protein
METANADSTMDNRTGILYPLMVIAAIAVIVFSAVGIATMLGWMPEALSSTKTVGRTAAAQAAPKPVREAITPCGECGRAEQPVRTSPAPEAAPRG